MMKEKKLGIISPHIFDDFLIISFSKQWISLNGKIPQFTVRIDCKNKLVIETLEEISDKL